MYTILFSVLIVLLFVYSFFLYEDKISYYNDAYNLEKDGFCICKNHFSEKEISDLIQNCHMKKYKEIKTQLIANEKLNTMIEKYVGHDYLFQDYIWIIEKSVVHTCHRDNNGDFFNEHQKYPSYTMILFLENMDKCLGVIPTSHTHVNSHNINFENAVIHILCNQGDVILFNANLIHVGAINEKKDNIRIQMKITHREDIEALSYYENYNKILNQDTQLPVFLQKAQKKISCMFPFVSNYTQQDNIRSSRGSDNGAMIGIPQKIFSYLFYGNSEFYDLPNIF